MSLVYYYSPMSSAARTTWGIEELGLPVERVLVDFRKGDTKKPEFRKLNPNAKVPLLVVDGHAIFESTAILIWLGETYGVEKGLYPKPGVERAETLKWMLWANVSLLEQGIQRLLRNASPRVPEEERNAKQAESAKAELATLLGILDDALAGREWLVGDHFSFADLAVAGYVPYMHFTGMDLSPWKNVSAWSSRCLSRPAVAKANG